MEVMLGNLTYHIFKKQTLMLALPLKMKETDLGFFLNGDKASMHKNFFILSHNIVLRLNTI